jgi:hypothetical protein
MVGNRPKIRRDVSAGAWLPGLAQTRLCQPDNVHENIGMSVLAEDHSDLPVAPRSQHGQDARATHGQDAHATAAVAHHGSSSAGGSASSGGRRPRPPKLYRIGEVVSYSGLSRQTVHNYTIMGLLHEAQWTEGGHRLYDESVFARLDEVVELKSQGKSLVEIREHCARLDEKDAAGQE